MEQQPNSPQPYPPHSYQYPPVRNRSNAFATASIILGVLSLISCMIIYMTVFFGSLSILFALLSRQESLQMPGSSQAGCVMSSVAITLSAVLTAISFVYLIALFGWETVQNPELLLEKMMEYMNAMGGMPQ